MRKIVRRRLNTPSAARGTPTPIPIFVPVVKPPVLELLFVGGEVAAGFWFEVVDIPGVPVSAGEVLDVGGVVVDANTYPLM
jgi:hypothetical protein